MKVPGTCSHQQLKLPVAINDHIEVYGKKSPLLCKHLDLSHTGLRVAKERCGSQDVEILCKTIFMIPFCC